MSESFPNGFIKASSELLLDENNLYKIDTHIELECEKYYKLVGTRLIKCLDSEKWSDEIPFCEFGL